MSERIFYLYDEHGNFIREHVHVRFQALPSERFTEVEPPPKNDDQFWVWTGSSWEVRDELNVPPPPPPPPVVYPVLTPRQIRLGLLSLGITMADVDAAINEIEDETLREQSRISWEYAIAYNRDDALVDQLGGAFGLTEEQINEAWLFAATL